MDETHEPAVDSPGLTDSVQISTRHYIASQHLWSAQHQARLCAEIEAAPGTAPLDIRHRTFAIGAVLSAVTFLESLVNETFQDAADASDHLSGRIAPLGEKCIALMGQFWNASESGSRYVNMLAKYQMALLFAERVKLDEAARPFQDAKLLVVIRNKLVHFRPAWKTQGEIGREERMLAGKFDENALMVGTGNPWFPDKCLGAGCAEWAWKSSLSLADEWTSRLGIPKVYAADLGSWPAP